jgi:heme oxygenase
MTILERLKLETRAAHDSIERVVDIGRRPGSLESYRHLLCRLFGFHSAWEPAADQALSDPTFFATRRKCELLRRDLETLGLRGADIASLPICRAPMRFDDPFAALGSMYVIEGSTLGGAIIAKAAERNLGLRAGVGSAYFRSYGQDTARMWKAFRERLLLSSSPKADDVMVVSAKATFGTMQAWLCER